MGCAYCRDFERILYFTTGRTSSFSLMFFYFPFSTNDGGENSFFSLRYNYTCWTFRCFTRPGAMARCKAILHGHAFVPFPGAALLLHWGHLCPWRTVGMKLASEERGNLWRDYGETHPQKKLNPDLRVAGYGKRPVPGSPGCPALGHLQARLGRGGPDVGVLPPTSLWSACPSRLVPTAVGGYWLWPANVHREQETGYGTVWQINDVDTDAVALSGVWGDVCAILKPGHAPHDTCVQRHMQAGNADASRGANLPPPPSPIYSCPT